jgi:membrane protease YdiL (CAAX protease family)
MSTSTPMSESTAPDLFVDRARPPRVWTALLSMLVVPIGAGLLGILPLAAYEMVAWGGHVGRVLDAIGRTPETGPELMVLLAGTYAAMVLLVVRFAAMSPTAPSVRARLELVPPRMRRSGWIAVPVGSLAVGGCVSFALEAAGVDGFDAPALEPLETLRGAWVVVLVAWACLVGPFAEELLFRGYVQTRLVARWGPIVGIAVTSTAFGLAHASTWEMLKAVSVVPLGVWLGWVAWRTRSMVTSTIAHVTLNAAGTAGFVLFGEDTHVSTRAAVVSCAVSAVLLVAAWRWMRAATRSDASTTRHDSESS